MGPPPAEGGSPVPLNASQVKFPLLLRPGNVMFVEHVSVLGALRQEVDVSGLVWGEEKTRLRFYLSGAAEVHGAVLHWRILKL